MPVTQEDFTSALAERLGEEAVRRLAEARIGIAGLGGLGSNIALLLARSGVGELVIADFDRVDLTNIHRQCYPLECIGMRKTDALEAEVSKVNPWCRIEKHDIRLTPDNLDVFEGCGIVCEALDRAEDKVMLAENLGRRTVLIMGNGMAGTGPADDIVTKRIGAELIVCGDGTSDVGKDGSFLSSRVAVCAAKQANAALRIIIGAE